MTLLGLQVQKPRSILPISVASASLLTTQATPEGGPSWDVLQESTAAHDQVVLSAVQSDTGVPTINVKPTGLQPETIYQVRRSTPASSAPRPARR